MWTRNYYNLLTAGFLGDVAQDPATASQPSSYAPPIKVHCADNSWCSCGIESGMSWKDTNYVPRDLFIGMTSAYLMTSESANTSGFRIGFGSGTANESYEDYKLSNLITSGLNLVSSSGVLTPSSFNSETHVYSSSRTFTITATANVTVREMGIYVPTILSGNGRPVLVYREKFDEAIELANGESILLTIKHEGQPFNYTPY